MKKGQKELGKERIVIAVGGTGGHLRPAQALAKDLLKQSQNLSLLFMGAKLSSNPYLKEKTYFAVQDIPSATPFQGNLWANLKACFSLLKGTRHSLKWLRKFRPHCVVGFGSFHSFPILLAAKIKRIPIVLFESNAQPGRVNRLCSSWAKKSAVLPFVNQGLLKGEKTMVKMPFLEEGTSLCQKKARHYYSLEEELLTILVFGGSQGAKRINEEFCMCAKKLFLKKVKFQVIHIVGNKENVDPCKQFYSENNIPACIKSFEEKMSYAWSAADFSISRAGSMTIAEQIQSETPGILIPYPYAADHHQAINATFLTKEVGAGITISEESLSEETLLLAIEDLISHSQRKLKAMEQVLIRYKMGITQTSLSSVIFKEVKQR